MKSRYLKIKCNGTQPKLRDYALKEHKVWLNLFDIIFTHLYLHLVTCRAHLLFSSSQAPYNSVQHEKNISLVMTYIFGRKMTKENGRVRKIVLCLSYLSKSCLSHPLLSQLGIYEKNKRANL